MSCSPRHSSHDKKLPPREEIVQRAIARREVNRKLMDMPDITERVKQLDARVAAAEARAAAAEERLANLERGRP